MPVWGQDGATDWDNSTQADDFSVIAFVGEKTFVEEREKPQFMDFEMPDGRVVTRKLPAFDTRYEARYSIKDIVHGDYKKESVDFVAYNHYGRPGFPHVNPVLLFLVNYEDEWVHSKYLFYPVRATTDGDWAICGPAASGGHLSEENKTLAASYEEPLGFLEPVKSLDGEICIKGTRAVNLYKFQERIRFGPRHRRVTCNREMGFSDGIVVGTGSHPTAEAEGRTHAACVERLEANSGL